MIGRTVLVRCHHGLGDTIQFARYLPILEPLVRRLIIWAPVSLHPLLASCTQSGLLLPLENGEPDVDREVDVEIMELAHAFRTTIDTIPHSGPYLNGGARHSATRFLRVGIAWRAGNWDPRRSLPFEAAERVSRIPGAKVYSLHRELADEEARCGMLHDSRCVTVHGTAQLIRSLDLVISVDSMPAHLAGALGVSVWTLLPTEPDWRWMLDRSDSPWYPTMRLFRQPAPANWDSPIAGMRRSLETLLRSRRGPRAA